MHLLQHTLHANVIAYFIHIFCTHIVFYIHNIFCPHILSSIFHIYSICFMFFIAYLALNFYYISRMDLLLHILHSPISLRSCRLISVEVEKHKIDLFFSVSNRDRLINRTYRLIAHSTSDFDDRLQFHKIDYLKSFLKTLIVSRNSLLFKWETPLKPAQSWLISSSTVTSKTKGFKGYLKRVRSTPLQKWSQEPVNYQRLPKENCAYTTSIINRSSVVKMDRWLILKIVTDSEH